jgi:hypothetical protein
VLAREIVEEKIVLDESTALIPSVSRNYQLLQKAESFVSRRMVKTRDAFDMRLLLAEGAALDENIERPFERSRYVARVGRRADQRAN